MDARATGMLMEAEACTFLESRGYRILERNFWAKTGEIDAVARLGEALVFVEVRYRRPGSLVSAEESVTVEKARRLRSAVRRYLWVRGVPDKVPVRVDLVVVRGEEPHFEVIPGILEFD